MTWYSTHDLNHPVFLRETVVYYNLGFIYVAIDCVSYDDIVVTKVIAEVVATLLKVGPR